MDIDNENTNSSLVNLNHKPPAKGRKKKSAVAKLAEKKRGSQVSLPREDSNPKETNKPKEEKSQESENSTVNGGKEGLNEKHNFVNEKTDNEVKKSNNVRNAENELDKEKIDDSPPKPAPRKTSRRKPPENNFDGLEGGTVVSIYEKRERTPKEKSKRDSSPSLGKNGETNELSDKLKPQKELFPDKSKSGDALSVKPRSDKSFLSDLPPLEGSSSKKFTNVEDSPVPMDIDNDSDDGDENPKDDSLIEKNAPSDATVHRFRAMRMTPDRSRSEESLKNASFTPKPPSTPRSARKVTPPKGEKRNREANSSGEEADFETKKQNSAESANFSDNILNSSLANLQAVGSTNKSSSGKISDNILNSSLSNLQTMDGAKMEVDPVGSAGKERKKKGLSVHPNVKEVKDYTDELNSNQNMNVDSPERQKMEESTPVKTSGSADDVSSLNKELSADKNEHVGSLENLGDSKQSNKKSEKKKIVRKARVKSSDKKELTPLDGADFGSTGKVSVDTLGSASDLTAVREQYKEVLQSNSPWKSSSDGSSRLESVIPEPDPSTGKLAPIQPKHLPPPLPHDMKSASLRTTYKADPTYNMNKFFGRSMSGINEREKSKIELLSHRSLSSGMGTSIHAVPTREARDRMKQGTLGSTLLSSSELDKYFPERKVGLWVGSWNMAEIKDCKESLDDFLLPEVSEYVQDIYAIGTQENDMNKKEWEILLQETIGPSHVLFHSASHGALHLAVFVKRDLIWFCTVPEDDYVQTRAFTMVKTKGAIAIGFQFFGTSLIFINCHFAPGDAKKKERLDDFHKIVKQLSLPKQGPTGSPNSNSDVTTRFDCVFWMGDLNFRIESYKGKQAIEDIVKYIEEQEHTNFEDLLKGDQLSKLIVEGNIFQDFQEGRINFRPTYKYDIGQDTFDTSSKNRIPSYTDRVLFRAKKKNSIVCTHYDSPSNVRLSDHHPVYAIFDVAIQPARECSLPLAAGQFNREVYTEANKRLAMKVQVISTLTKEKSSKVCSIQ